MVMILDMAAGSFDEPEQTFEVSRHTASASHPEPAPELGLQLQLHEYPAEHEQQPVFPASLAEAHLDSFIRHQES